MALSAETPSFSKSLDQVEIGRVLLTQDLAAMLERIGRIGPQRFSPRLARLLPASSPWEASTSGLGRMRGFRSATVSGYRLNW
jgi:hypothetical protein